MRYIYLFCTTDFTDDEALHVTSLHVKYFLPIIDFDKYDYLIITSKQILKALQQYNDNWKKLNILAISPSTADAIKEVGGIVLQEGKGYGSDLSEIITSYDKNKKWLYLRAKEVASDFVQRCQTDGFKIDEIVMYKTTCHKDILHVKVQDDSTLIFTSPSSINCFLKTHAFLNTQKIVVIGKTTAKALPAHVKYSVADEPTLSSCIKKAKE